jgi:replication factor C subunit 3/5
VEIDQGNATRVHLPFVEKYRPDDL